MYTGILLSQINCKAHQYCGYKFRKIQAMKLQEFIHSDDHNLINLGDITEPYSYTNAAYGMLVTSVIPHQSLQICI
ncbi:hypothetical protein OWV82_009917 [Melia azedarach]|uniref:Uncharacterized protein n=1 Tax=Melia azedarach TaxID=155640 RepID=A0ACC1Y3B2_MELAZ|nr:hypothetical protein OWV82_009917 [Melia azedarach]